MANHKFVSEKNFKMILGIITINKSKRKYLNLKLKILSTDLLSKWGNIMNYQLLDYPNIDLKKIIIHPSLNNKGLGSYALRILIRFILLHKKKLHQRINMKQTKKFIIFVKFRSNLKLLSFFLKVNFFAVNLKEDRTNGNQINILILCKAVNFSSFIKRIIKEYKKDFNREIILSNTFNISFKNLNISTTILIDSSESMKYPTYICLAIKKIISSSFVLFDLLRLGIYLTNKIATTKIHSFICKTIHLLISNTQLIKISYFEFLYIITTHFKFYNKNMTKYLLNIYKNDIRGLLKSIMSKFFILIIDLCFSVI